MSKKGQKSSSSRQVRFLDESSTSNSNNNFFNDPLLKEYENLNVEELKNELLKLEKECDEKRLILENLKKSHSLRDVIDKENVNNNVNQNELQEHMVKEMLKSSKEREYEEILNAYRLTGKTIFTVKDNLVGLRLETFYKAKYREPYYIILDQNQDQENEQFSVFKHTLPHFIPLKELETTYLNKNMDKFVNAVDDYLQAFVIRREESNALLENGGIIELKSNNAYSVIEFKIPLEEDTDHVEVSLTYDDLKSYFPTNAIVHMDSGNKRQRLKRREQEFLQKSLSDAFNSVFNEV